VLQLAPDRASAFTFDQFGSFLDRLGPVHFGSLLLRRAAGAINDRARGAKFTRNTASRPTRRTGDESDFAFECH
jgi:hypothetical protein